MNQKDGKSAWGSAVSLEKREQFEERAETILLILKQWYPGIPQSSLDISKIQFNKVNMFASFLVIGYTLWDVLRTYLTICSRL